MGHISGITSRRMFGGYGIYKDKVFFGLIAEGILYFKVGASTQREYEKRNSKPFTYSRKNGKVVTMSYWEVPEEIMNGREHLEEWAEESVAIISTNKKHPSEDVCA